MGRASFFVKREILDWNFTAFRAPSSKDVKPVVNKLKGEVVGMYITCQSLLYKTLSEHEKIRFFWVRIVMM